MARPWLYAFALSQPAVPPLILMLAILLPQANDAKHDNASSNLGDIYTGECKI
jgi:hypothetical protein